MDLILGNIGENFYLRPDSAHPVKLWVNDYDQNGNIDNILSRTVDGKDMPVFLKHDMEFQMPILKKQNLKHGEFAKKTIQDMLPEDMIKNFTGEKIQLLPFDYCHQSKAMDNLKLKNCRLWFSFPP